MTEEQQRSASASFVRWLQQQPLLASCFTSQQQEASIKELTSLPDPTTAAAAGCSEPSGADDVVMHEASEPMSVAAAAHSFEALGMQALKQNLLRVEALVAEQIQQV